MHDGSVDLIERFLTEPSFTFNFFQPAQRDQVLANLVALMLSWSGSEMQMGSPTSAQRPLGPRSKDSHAAVGRQITFDGTNNTNPNDVNLLSTLIAQADAGQDFTPGPEAALVARGIRGGLVRGYSYVGGVFQSDRAGETISPTDLRLGTGPGEEITFMAVPRGTQTRIGIDRDEDGHLDRDELDGCGDPADAAVIPRPRGDLNLDGRVDTADVSPFTAVLLSPTTGTPQQRCLADMNQDGSDDGRDVGALAGALVGG